MPLGTSGSNTVKSHASAAAALVISLNGRGALSSVATGLNASTGGATAGEGRTSGEAFLRRPAKPGEREFAAICYG